MATKVSKNTLAPLKTDLTAALIVGVVAGILSPIAASANNLNVSWTILLPGFVVLCVAGIMVGRFMNAYIPVLYKLAKFGEAGGLNWLVDLGVFSLLTLAFGTGNLELGIGLTVAYASIYKGISFIIAATNSYFWSKLWVFAGGKAQKETTQLSKFVVATLLGLGVNVFIFTIVYNLGPTLVTSITAARWGSIGVIIGSLGAMLFNFILYKVWVFKN